jgi:hypothetical protein
MGTRERSRDEKAGGETRWLKGTGEKRREETEGNDKKATKA